MVEFNEDFEGAADGVGATNLTTAFFGNSNPAATMSHSSLRSILGTKSLRINNPTGPQNLYNVFSPVRNLLYRRVYWYAVDITTALVIMSTQTGGTLNGSNVFVTAAGVLRLRDGTTTTATSALTVAVGQWYRFEQFVDAGTGTHSLRVFTGANLHGTTPDDTISGALTVGTFDRAVVGTNALGTIDWFYDSYVDNQSTWVGPANVGGGRLLLEDASGDYFLEDGTGRLITEDFVIPALNATDNFNRGTLGPNWNTTATPVTLDGAQVIASTAQNAQRWSTPVTTGIIAAQSKFKGGTLSGPAVAMPGFVDGSTFASTGSWYALRNSGTGVALVQKDNLAGTYTQLDAATLTLAVDDLLRLEYNGTTLNGYVNGVFKVTATPASPLSISAQPYVGFGHGAGGQSGTALLDDWAGGDSTFTIPSTGVDVTDFFLVL
jgi:hypothetical protein